MRVSGFHRAKKKGTSVPFELPGASSAYQSTQVDHNFYFYFGFCGENGANSWFCDFFWSTNMISRRLLLLFKLVVLRVTYVYVRVTVPFLKAEAGCLLDVVGIGQWKATHACYHRYLVSVAVVIGLHADRHGCNKEHCCSNKNIAETTHSSRPQFTTTLPREVLFIATAARLCMYRRHFFLSCSVGLAYCCKLFVLPVIYTYAYIPTWHILFVGESWVLLDVAGIAQCKPTHALPPIPQACIHLVSVACCHAYWSKRRSARIQQEHCWLFFFNVEEHIIRQPWVFHGMVYRYIPGRSIYTEPDTPRTDQIPVHGRCLSEQIDPWYYIILHR